MGNTILLADKSITIQKIVELTFTEDQFEVKCVSDGQAALDLIPQIRPDIVLADISLPLKTGYEVCSAIRTDPTFAAFSQVPVILLAGIYETMDEERAKQVEEKVKEVGANDLLSKPFDPQLLTAKVKDLVRKPVASHYEDQRLSPGSFSFESPDNPFLASDSYQPPHSTDDTGRFDVVREPPDDSERTMILPGPPSFSSGDIFAQAPPFEPEDTVAQSSGLPDLDAIKPVNEPIFDANEMANEGVDQLFSSIPEKEDGQQEQLQSSESLFDSGEISSTGEGWQEREFEMPGSYGDAEQEPMNLLGGEEQENSPDYGGSDLASVEEPFGDMAGEPTNESVSWGGFNAPEDESPFGLSEPIEKSIELHVEETIISPEAEQNIVKEFAIVPEETPLPEEPPLDFKAEPEPEEPVLDFKAEPEESETPIADNIDTWSQSPGMMMAAEEPVVATPEPAAEESAMPSQPEPSEEAEELQPDLAEAGFTPDTQVRQSEEAPVTAASSFNPAQITDEFIDRVVERVLAKISTAIVSDVVWQVVPDLAEKMIRRELEKLRAGEEE